MLSPVSLQTFEFNDKGFSMKVEDDKICFTKDGETTNVYFNCLYNKNEIDNLIAGDIDPNYLRNICLTAVNQLLAELVTYTSLVKDEDKLHIATKDVKHASNQLYELFNWTNDNFKVIVDTFNDINQCHCMDEGGFHDQITLNVQKLRNDVDASDEYIQLIVKPNIEQMKSQMYNLSRNCFQISPTQLLSPLKEISFLYNEGVNFLISTLSDIWKPINDNDNIVNTAETEPNEKPDGRGSESLEPAVPDYPVIDPSQEISKLTVPLIDDPHKRTFDEKKPVYGTLTLPYDLQVNGLINGIDITDIQPGPTPGDSYFKKTDGYNYFYVKNENVDIEDYIYEDIECNKLSINGISAATINKLKTMTGTINLLRFILRKNEVFDDVGNFIKEFYCYVENKRLFCPVITLSQTKGLEAPRSESDDLISYTIDCVEVSWDEKPFIAFDKHISFEPYALYLRGELSIMYLLPQDTIESIIPEIKCDIINARNALKLHESNVIYLYKPSRITENDDYYSMTFHIPNDYVIPTDMTFTFNEFCFNNNWSMTWNGTEWIGNNIQGRSNGKVLNKLNRFCDDTDYVVAVGINKSDFNKYVITRLFFDIIDETFVLKNIFDQHKPIINGIFDNDEDFTVERDELQSLQSVLKVNVDSVFSDSKQYPVYDDIYACPVGIYIDVNNKDISKYKETYLKHVKEITLDLNIGGASNKFSFRLTSTEPHDTYADKFGYALRIDPVNDYVEELSVLVQGSDIDKTTKDVTLYMDRGVTRPREEINWNSSANPFQYIIDQQFYNITPNPNASTTLYTDFNITSSKIITADNITTMRSDLNVVANTTDVISSDVKSLERRCDNIQTELHQVERVVQHIQEEVNTLKIEAGFALALSCAATVLSVGNTLELAGNYISLGFGKLRNLCSRGYVRLAESSSEVEMLSEDMIQNPLFIDVIPQALTYDKTEMTKLVNWINAEHVDPKFSDKYASTEDDGLNPENIYISYATTQNLCIHYRDSLKPAFKLIVDKFDDIDNEMKNKVTFNDFVEIGEEVPEIIFTPHNTRMWIKFNNKIKEGEINLRVTWMDTESDFDDLKIKLDLNEITEFSCTHEEELSRYTYPYFDEEGKIVIDANDEMSDVELLKSSVKVFIPQVMENIVYKDVIDSLDERVKRLEKGGNLTANPDIERRLLILEAKCKNIVINDEPMITSINELTIEERLQILERKCANIHL